MSFSVIHTRACVGIDAPLVSVETHISNGLPALAIVGLPEAAVKESKERVRSALINSGFQFPTRRVTINLAPADLPKQGGRYDLAIALGILTATKQIQQSALDRFEFYGELALNGELRSVFGVLPSVIASSNADRACFVPQSNLVEAKIFSGAKIFCAEHLSEVCAHFSGKAELTEVQACAKGFVEAPLPNLKDVRGQLMPRRALEIAAAGGHNLLLYGPPGTGKSMLAERLPSIMPKLDPHESIDVASIYSIKGEFEPSKFSERPFRSPHHSSSSVALIGGGSQPLPGEISMAHNGVLFLDELPEFGRKALEMLREPIESGVVTISRAKQTVRYPARFQLVAAMNPCPCGYLGHPTKACTDSPQQIINYQKKLSGPLLDRFDMHVEVSAQSGKVILGLDHQQPESSEDVLVRVNSARQIQLARQAKLNSDLRGSDFDIYCGLEITLLKKLEDMMDKLALSARSAYRIIRVARTIADLNQHSEIEQTDLMEALMYRNFDKRKP